MLPQKYGFTFTFYALGALLPVKTCVH